MRITSTITKITEVPDDAVLVVSGPGRSEERLYPVRHAASGVWVQDHRGADADGWTFYSRPTST